MKKIITTAVLVVAGLCLLLSSAAEAKRLPWCGIYMNQYFGLSKRSLWVARNWAYEGTPSAGPAVGAVVVWRNHVGVIAGPPDASGRWLVHSGNDGNAVRTRYRSLRGAIAFRHVGTATASQNFNLKVEQHASAGRNENLSSLRAERRRSAAPLREARATTKVARKITSPVGASTVAQPARLTYEARPQQIASVSESTGVFLSAGGGDPQTVHKPLRKSRSESISHRREPRIDLAPAEHRPNSRALQRWASHTPHDTRWQDSAERAPAFYGAVGSHAFQYPAARRGYRR